jgi:hypothetical protein
MASKMPSKSEMLQELAMLDRVTNALNTACVAMMYIMKVKGNELDKVKTEDYVKYVTEHVHPLMKRADEIVKEAAAQAKKEIDEAVDEIEKEKK